MKNPDNSYRKVLLRRARRLLDTRFSGHRERILAFRDLHAGRRAFVIGNGPSVQLDELDRLGDELTFCCNRFHLAYPLIHFRPRYTLVADAHMMSQFGNEIADHCEAELIVAAAYMPRRLDGEFTWVRLRRRDPFQFNRDIATPIAPGGSVVTVALQLAFYMGIREVYLYGMDHDFSFTRAEPNSDLVSGDGNHFIPNYRSGKPWHPPEKAEIENSLATCRDFYDSQGGRILNATHGGKLEIFERVDFEQALTATPSLQESTMPAVKSPRQESR